MTEGACLRQQDTFCSAWESIHPPKPLKAPHPDDVLLSKVECGDLSGALKILVTHYGSEVLSYCRRLVKDSTLAEDVHQQVLLEACRSLPSFEPRASVRTWLYTIARHRAFDALKAQRRALVHIVASDEQVQFVVREPSAEEAVDTELDARRLRQALHEILIEISEPTRSALLLRYREGLTYEEMGRLVGESPGTLQRRVVRALPTLRAALKRAGFCSAR